MGSTPAYWSQRALTMGERAGTQDLIAAELERRAIERRVRDGMRILDPGCGDGRTAIRLALKYRVDIQGTDSAEKMIAAARANLAMADVPTGSGVYFFVEDVLTGSPWPPESFDLVFTQRLIVNLGTWERQRAAIERMLSWLRPGGTLLLVECSQDGLDGVNELRGMVGLPVIVAPSHNRYLREDEMWELVHDLTPDRNPTILVPRLPEPICSTYALLARIVNAKLAQDAGVPPAYDSPINRLALELPNIGDLGQNRLWRWVKA